MRRNKQIDIAKGIGIILVVLGHAEMPHSSIVFRFHMALFFFLSGWCFSDKYLKDVKSVAKYLINKVKGLYVPFVLFNGIALALRNILIKINIYTDNQEFLEPTNYGAGYYFGLTMPISWQEFKLGIWSVITFQGETQLGGATWFLRVLFGVSIVWIVTNYLIQKVLKGKTKIRFVINLGISFVAMIFSYYCMKNSIHYPMQFETVCSAYIVFVVGYYVKKVYKEQKYYLDIVVFVLSFGVLLVCDKVCLINGWNSNVNDFANPIMYVISSSAGVLCVLSVSEFLCRYEKIKIIEVIGKNTLIVLLLHFLAFKLVTLVQCMIYDLPLYRVASFPALRTVNGWWLVYAIVGVGVPFGFKYLFSETIRRYRSK